MNDILANALSALERISKADPQSDTCGSAAPDICENGCIGCIARTALEDAKVGLMELDYVPFREATQ